MAFIAYHQTDGSPGAITAAAAANDAAILDHFENQKGELALPYGGFLFRNSIRTLNAYGAQNWGGKIKGSGGQTFTLAENQYNSGNSFQIGGSATRLVCDVPANRNLTGGAFFIIDTCELELESIVVQGLWDPTDPDVIKNNSGDWTPIGILVKNNAGKVGMGKLHALALTIIACQDAIVCGEGNDGDNADQLFIGELHTYHCTTGIKLRDVRSVGHYIAQYEGIYTDVMLDIEHGGKLHGGNWTMLKRNSTMIRVSGNVGGEASVIIDHVIVDSHVEHDGGNQAKIIDMTDVNGGAFRCTIGKLNIDNTLVMKDAIRLRQRAQLDILSGLYLRKEMIHVSSLASAPTHRAHINVCNCTFKDGHTPYELISPSSGSTNAAFLIEVKGCRSELGAPFPDRKWSRDNAGNVTVHYHDSPAVESHSLGLYELTTSSSQYIFNGSGSAISPLLTLNPPGSKWRITCTQHLRFDGLTYASGSSLSIKLRRTNNSPADLTNSYRFLNTGPRSNADGTWVIHTMEVLYTVTQTGGDIIAPFGGMGSAPSSGSIYVYDCQLSAVPVCQD